MTKQWTPNEITRMMTNPLYTGITVHPDLAVTRPVYRDKFIDMARSFIESHASPDPNSTYPAELFLREFLHQLRQPDTWILGVVKVHPQFTVKHDGILSIDQFVRNGALQIRDLGLETYCAYLLDILEAGE
jgi:hypothetical protein